MSALKSVFLCQLQVIEDEDLVAILKDVSGDTFEENNCDFKCDITEKAGVKKSVHNKISTAEIVTEAIQRIDNPGKSSGFGSGSSSRMENRVEGNKKLLVQQQRQRHSSTKKNRKKSGYQPILPAPTPSDIDLYLNSNSNVSPDSGIQSDPSGLNNSSPPQILPGGAGNSGNNSGNNETVLQFSPGSTTTVYTQWPPNGYFSGISTGQDCYSTGTNPGYILSNSGTTLMAVVTPVQTAQHTTNAQTQNPASVSDPDLPTILPTPTIMLENPDILNPMIKRGRGRPKGSKNKKKTVTCESGCQTIESSLESTGSTGSKKSESPISVFDEDEEPPPPIIFLENGSDISDRTPSKIRKDPPRLEPQVELRNSGARSASAGLSDSDTIMFSDGEDDPDPEPPVIRIPELPPTVKLKKKKKKKNRSEPEHQLENLPPTLSKPKKQKRKKRNKEYLRASSPPLLEPELHPVKSPASSAVPSLPEFRPITSDYSSSKSPEEELFPKSPVREEPEYPSSPPQISIPELPDNSETFEEVPVEVSPVVSPARSSSKPDSAEENSENDQDGPPILTVPDDEPQEQPMEHLEKPSSKPNEETPVEEEPFQFCELKPVFSAKYRTLKVDKFWKTKKKKSSKKVESSITTSNNQPLVQTIPQVVTKAAVKEIVNVPLKSSSSKSVTKTMLAVLKSTNLKSKPGRRKKKGSSSSSTKVIKEQQQCFSPKSVHSSTGDESESKSKKSINKSLIEMGWRTKHKNVIDPLFLGLLEQMIQDMSNVQMDKKLSKDLWPDRPNSSLPTIFKKRKFIQETTKVTKRGRPKKTEAEQRLPLKKRHHHVDSSESKDQKGRISRKASTEDQKTKKNPSSVANVNKSSTTQLSNQNGNNAVSSKNIVDSIAACVDKYTKKDFSQPLTVSIQENVGQSKPSTTPRKRHLLQMQDQNESAPPTLEVEKTSEKSRERPSSPPKLTKFDELISNKNNPLTSPISEDETRRPTPPNMYRPKVSDISDASDVDPISPKVIKIIKHNDVMHCSVKLKKLSEEKNVDQQKATETTQKSNLVEEKSNEEEVERLTNKDLSLKKKKKRKANKTGFPAIKKKKKVLMSKDDEKTSQSHHHNKRQPQKVLKKVQSQPSRASPRILENKSDTDSRPSSRLEQSTVTTIKVIEQPKRPETPTSAPPPTKRSKLYEDIDENIDCLGLLPPQENTEEMMEIVEEQETSKSSKKPKKRGIHLFKKNYLIAGLFSNFYKETDPLKQRNLVPISKVQYNESDHIHGLLPPPYYCGRQLREKKEDFTLPYDLWWQNANKQLPGRDVVPTWNYKKISKNVYFDVAKPVTKGYEMQACQCKRCGDDVIDQPCREDCINRMTYTECDNDLCHHPEDKCANRRIQQQKFSKTNIERFMTVNKGWGIKTKIPILPGDFIMEYVGEVVSEKEFKLRMLTEYVEDTHHYCLHLDGGTVIDGHRMGNECRFVNHSCQPNCEMQKWNVNGVFRMALFALTDIGIDEELTYDYNFSLFNPHEGQKCRCLSKNCRGVIGGKTQRIAIVEESSTSSTKSKRKQERTKAKKEKNQEAFSLMTSLKPLTAPQKSYAKEHHCFLVRNYEKVRVFREALKGHFNDKTEEMIKTGLTALSTARSVQTRKLTNVKDDPKVTKMVKLAQILKDILNQLDQDLLKYFKDLPNRKKVPLYFELIEEPIDLSTIENRVNSGSYDPWQFDRDLIRLFQNHLRFYGSQKAEGQASLTLKNQYNEIKLQYLAQLEEASEQILSPGFCVKPPIFDNCDVIDCPCGQFKEEGTMIQCEKCQIWQHLDCVTPPEDPDLPYFCGKCSGQKPDLDIRIVPQPDHYPGDVDYVSLMRGNLQIRLDDTVYVLRAGLPKNLENPDQNPDLEEGFNLGGIQHKMMSPVKGPSQEASKLCNYPSYKDMPADSSVENMDIFRVERLWINNKGERFAFGYHYLRPNETFHEASRKFFRNEVFRIPIYEVLPLDSIWRQCWVMDLATFCKGRPKGALEEDVYICEYRVDKKARLFDKIPKSSSKSNSKNKFPAICTKWFAFDSFDIKLKPVRSYTVSALSLLSLFSIFPQYFQFSIFPHFQKLKKNALLLI